MPGLENSCLNASPRSGDQAGDIPLQGEDEPKFNIADAFWVLARQHNVSDALGGTAELRQHALMDAIRQALEQAGVEFILENGGGPGVRLAKLRRKGRLC